MNYVSCITPIINTDWNFSPHHGHEECLFFQVMQCDRQVSDSDSGPTADSQTAGPGRDPTDPLSRFAFLRRKYRPRK